MLAQMYICHNIFIYFFVFFHFDQKHTVISNSILKERDFNFMYLILFIFFNFNATLYISQLVLNAIVQNLLHNLFFILVLFAPLFITLISPLHF